MVLDYQSWGQYPKEYNREVHGPYHPMRYYGKPDTPLAQVKLGELPAWFGRRSKNPRHWAQAISRAWYRFQHTWVHPKYAGPAGMYQLMIAASMFFLWVNYDKLKYHRNYKYH